VSSSGFRLRVVRRSHEPVSVSGYAGRVSRFWGFFWPRWYRALRLADPLLRRLLRHSRLGNVVQLTVRGRHTGVPRAVLLGLLADHGRWYLGHPDVACPWTLNLTAAGEGILARPGAAPLPVRASLLDDGLERERAIRATFREHVFPGNVIYWLARDHVRRVGVFFRVEPIGQIERDRPGQPAGASEPGT
jgi:hypothetical protein